MMKSVEIDCQNEDTALVASSASLMGSARGSGALIGSDRSPEIGVSSEDVKTGICSGSLFGIVEGDLVASLRRAEATRI